jgi:hypothetical protein
LPLAQSIFVVSKILLGLDTVVPQAVAAIALPPPIKKQQEKQRKNILNTLEFIFLNNYI